MIPSTDIFCQMLARTREEVSAFFIFNKIRSRKFIDLVRELKPVLKRIKVGLEGGLFYRSLGLLLGTVSSNQGESHTPLTPL
jgi:hypothetical protein